MINQQYRTGALVILVFFVALTVAACGTRDKGPALRVETIELKLHPSGARILTGTVFNDSDIAVGGAQIQITLFDDKNRRVDGMYAVVREIPAHGSADFREPVQSDYDVQAARVRSVVVLN